MVSSLVSRDALHARSRSSFLTGRWKGSNGQLGMGLQPHLTLTLLPPAHQTPAVGTHIPHLCSFPSFVRFCPDRVVTFPALRARLCQASGTTASVHRATRHQRVAAGHRAALSPPPAASRAQPHRKRAAGIELGRQSTGPCAVVWPRCPAPALPAGKHRDTDVPCSPHPRPRAARGKRPPANFPRPTNFGAGRRPQRFLLATLPLAAIPGLTLRAAAGVGTSPPVLCHRARCLMSPSLGVPCTILVCFCSQAPADAKVGHGWVSRCSQSLLHLRKQSWIRRMGPQEQGLAQQ